tara:strand:- start:1857 stop:2453 length:597 start_codon:yes stop_codon:yes gene_type:complete
MAQQKLEVKGIQETLAALNKIDPTYRRDVTKRIKRAGEPMVQEARSMITTIVGVKGAPLSGMNRGSLIRGKEITWRTDAVQKGFKIKVGVRASKERYVNFARYTDGVQTHTEQVSFGSKPYKLMVMQQADAAGAIYDHAGRRNGGMFVTNLNADGGGQQPRVIDKAVENNKPAVQSVVQQVISDVEKKTNRTLKQRYR